MPKLKKIADKQFSFPLVGKEILFANNPGQKTYIKNRVDRLLSKEPETIKWLNGMEKDSVFFDIGANIGIYSLYSAIKTENDVYAFEPHSANYKNLLDSINLNKLENCQAWCMAVSNRISLSHIGVKNMHEGVADNVVDNKGGLYHGCIEMHLDYLVGKKILPHPDYIKIDVDGFEDRVYKGAILSIQQAKSVLIEIDQKHEHIVSQIINLGLHLESKHRRNSEEHNYIFVK
jgi:FkbM family methyltransferase